MRKTLSLAAFVLLFTATGFAQQDAMFTKYMFNSLIFNPGYAGSRDHLYAGLLHRSQWLGFDGAPTTQTLTAHTPLKNERVGVGLSLINDEIGPTNTIGANLSYAYRIPVGEKSKLSVGLQAGLEQYSAKWSELDIENPDATFGENINELLPNFGVGIYFYNKHFYAGASVPHLVENDLRKNVDPNQPAFYARQVRHYYFTTGTAIPLNGDDLIFKPSILVKAVGLLKSQSKLEEFRDIGAPVEIDVDLSLLFYETLWVGAAVRTATAQLNFDEEKRKSSFDSADIWASYFLGNGLRIGAAFDYPLSKINTVTAGSVELMLGYEFNYKENKIATPRYF